MNAAGYAIRPARPSDVPAVVAMVHELAAYEHAAQRCELTDTQLRDALFAARPALFGHLAEAPSGEPVGFALWFLNYSTWLGSHGIYLEDLYVRPAARGAGLGRALLATLAGICVERGYPRMDWWVLDWNPAREFYHSLGAAARNEWVPYRMETHALSDLASQTHPAPRP